MLISTVSIILCSVAALVAGFIDSIAGGGGFITVPAMLLTGIPPHVALGSGKLGACLGSGIALYNFARSGLVAWRVALVGVGFSLTGAYIGSRLTLFIDSALLGKILVAMLPLGIVFTLFPHRKSEPLPPVTEGLRFWLLAPLTCFTVGVYDGFFGPGTGTFFILAFHYALRMSLLASSATAKVLNFSSNAGSLVAFLASGNVAFVLALPMAVGSVLGNWLGSRMAIRLGGEVVRRFLVFSMVMLFVTLLYRYFLS